MAIRALTRLKSSCSLHHLRNLGHTSQDTRKAFSYNFTSTASTDENLEQKSENPSETTEALHISEEVGAVHGTEEVGELATTDDGQFQTSIKVGAPYIRVLVGRRGTTRNNIQRITKARILVPPAKEVRSNVSLVIKGPSQESVDAAVENIRNILKRAEQNSTLEYSHFVSLPLASHEGLVKRMRSFKEAVLDEEREGYVSWFPATTEMETPSDVPKINSTGKAVPKIKARYVLDPDLEGFFSDDDDDDELSDDENEKAGKQRGTIRPNFFIKPQTVHMTLFMLKLFTDERVNLAAEVLQDVKPRVLEALDGREPRVHLRGIELLRGRPSEARVLSMRVEEVDRGNRLYQACQIIKDAYKEAGLVSEAEKRQDIKLHATLMSTSFGGRWNRNPFDARKILNKYGLEHWGEHTVKEVHLSQRFFYDPNGYYRCCASFELPPASPVSLSAESSAA